MNLIERSILAISCVAAAALLLCSTIGSADAGQSLQTSAHCLTIDQAGHKQCV